MDRGGDRCLRSQEKKSGGQWGTGGKTCACGHVGQWLPEVFPSMDRLG